MANVIKRHQYADYLKVDSTFVLMGIGFTSLNETPGAQSESVKYVNEVTSSSTVVSYETQFPFEAEQIAEESAIEFIYKVGRDHLTGKDAETEYVRVELWNPASGQSGKFAARKFIVSVEVSEIAGESKMSISGNLNAVGDPVDGTFDTSTKTFTAVAG